MKRIIGSIILVLFPLGFNLIAQEVELKEATTFKFAGFAKTDFLFTQYNNGAYSGIGRDFHIPSTIPVGSDDVYSYTDFHVKESRFNIEVAKPINGKKLRTYIEMDFMASAAGDERVSNSYNPRMRHFYFEYDKFLFGQTWSTFMITTIPDELDFLGAPEGVVFVRQPQARVTLGNVQLSLENPFVTYNGYQSATRQTYESALIPDIVARYNLNSDAGKFSVAVIARQLQYASGDSIKETASGFGATVGGTMDVGSKDDIRFVGTVGSGLGRYLAVNFLNSSVIDAEGKLKPVFTFNGYVAYLHHWTDKLRSSFSFSYIQAAFDEDIAAASLSQEAWSISANLLYAPAPKVTLGIEPIYGTRKVVGGDDGDMFRLQASAKWAFSFKTSVN